MHKTIQNLVAKVRDGGKATFRSRSRLPNGMKGELKEVWAVECADGDYTLYHYGTNIFSTWYNGNYWDFAIHVHRLSVSDQQGINGLLEALGSQQRVSRAGRTRKYA